MNYDDKAKATHDAWENYRAAVAVKRQLRAAFMEELNDDAPICKAYWAAKDACAAALEAYEAIAGL